MRNKLIASAALACSAFAVAAAPMVATAQTHHRHRVEVCRDASSRGARNTGTAVGAVAGGLLGNALAHGGGKTGGTILGAGAGAVVGHQYAKHNTTHRVCHYEWRD
ncbi:MAG: glycine zipper 2TM domain-containing protein [Phenylobacterium sp.]